MYNLKYQNVEKVVSTEIEKNKLIQSGYTLYDGKETGEESIEDTQDDMIQEIQNTEQTEEVTQTKKGRGKNAK